MQKNFLSNFLSYFRCKKTQNVCERKVRIMKYFYEFESLEEYIEYLFNCVREVEENEKLFEI